MPWVEDNREVKAAGGRWVESDQPEASALGLVGRAAVQAVPQAVLGLPALLADAYDSLSNMTISGMNYGAEALNWANRNGVTRFPQTQHIPAFRSSGAVNDIGARAADAVGLPRAETKMQDGLTKIGTAALGALGGAGVAKLASAAPGLPAAVRTLLAALGEAPKIQAAGAATSTLAQDLAQKNGVTSPLALMAIGALGGAGPSVPATIASRTAGGLVQVARPFTQAGREVVVGKALNRIATNPEAASINALNAQEIVPGSAPTLPQVARDPGLAAADNAVRGLDTRNAIGGRLSQQNDARMQVFDRMAGDEGTLAQATAKRDATYDQLARPAFANKSPVDPTAALTKIDEITRSRAGVRTIVKQAMGEARSRIEGIINSGTHDPTDPQNLYEVRKDLADLRDGKYNTDKSDYRLAKGEIADVIKSLDAVIESGAPGYTDYLKLYSKRSIPLDQLEALQTIRSKAVLATTDQVTGQPVLSNAKFQTLLSNNLDRGLNLRGRGAGAAKLSQNQIANLDRIAADLDRASAPSAGTVKVPGSDTFKNLSVASVIGRILGDQTGALASENSAVKSAVRPLSFLYRVPDEQIQQLMLEAWLDPKLAGRFMRKATQHEIDSIANELKQRASRQAVGAAIYGSAAE